MKYHSEVIVEGTYEQMKQQNVTENEVFSG